VRLAEATLNTVLTAGMSATSSDILEAIFLTLEYSWGLLTCR
jgi:hypothetical protein